MRQPCVCLRACVCVCVCHVYVTQKQRGKLHEATVCVCARACVPCAVCCVHMLSCSIVSDSATLWTVACQAFCLCEFPGKNTWVAISYSRGSLWPRDHLLHWHAVLYQCDLGILDPLQKGTEADGQMILSESLRCVTQGCRLWNSPETAITLRGNQVTYASCIGFAFFSTWLPLFPHFLSLRALPK